jgi:hypothetical protein
MPYKFSAHRKSGRIFAIFEKFFSGARPFFGIPAYDFGNGFLENYCFEQKPKLTDT